MVGVVGQLAANISVVLVLFENLNIERGRLVGMRQRAHDFLHAGENLLAALLPIGSRLDWGRTAIGLAKVSQVLMRVVIRIDRIASFGECVVGATPVARDSA